MPRLIVAGQAWDDVTDTFVGGRVIRLEAGGAWTELFTSTDSGCSRLKEFTIGGLPHLFFIESNGTVDLPQRGTLWRSSDEGDTWTDISPGGGPPAQYTMSYSLGAAGRIWAITDPREDPATIVGGPSLIYYSDDQGDTWTLAHTIAEVSFGTRGWPLYNIAADPNDANLIVVEGVEMVALDVRMWRSADGGGTWTAAFDPVFAGPTDVDNFARAYARQLDYASDGTLVYITRAVTGSATSYIFRSADDGATWAIWHSEALAANDGSFFLEDCGGNLWFVTENRVWKATDFTDTPPTQIADAATAPFTGDRFQGLACEDGVTLDLGTHELAPDGACCGPPGLWQRPIDLGTGWVAHPSWASMDGDLGYRVYPWVWGLVGATIIPTPPPDRYELPCEDEDAAGDFEPQCIPISTWEISVDGQHAYYTRARAQGMGVNNAGAGHSALLPNEGVWAPTGGLEDAGGTYNVRRELVVTDYGINDAGELDNLAGAYIPTDSKTLKGITTIKFQFLGIPRASASAPVPNKIIQAGDGIRFGCGSVTGCGIGEGDWVVDSIEYAFPKCITTIVASRRPAAHERSARVGNIRTLGESLGAQAGIYESPWFSVDDEEFYVDPDVAFGDPGKFYDTFQFNHYLGVIPRIIIMVAAKQKIYDWYDDVAVVAAQPLYVPRSFIDLSQVQGVGYNILDTGAAADNKIAFFFWRYLFYDDIDGDWIRPQDRFLKVWVMA